jgi:hypothetical protein
VTCPHCGQPGHYVNGHYECPVVRGFVFDGCCSGEVADGLPGAAGNDFAWQAEPSFGSNVRMGTEMPVVLARPCPCSGLLDLAYCGICGTANICESEPDVDDVVKAA